MSNLKKIPVLLITFIRNKNIRKLLKILDNRYVSRIYIYSNYSEEINDIKKIDNIRKIIKKNNLKKKYYFSKKYRPVHESIPYAISWFFSNEKNGIILEDDCLPNIYFFKFCLKNINKLNNQKYMLISGNRYSPENKNFENLYTSIYFHGWGWATTKNNWKDYVNYLRNNQNKKKLFNLNQIQSFYSKIYWKNIFSLIRDNKLFSWDYMLQKYIFAKKKFCIIPNKNLVKNNGIDKFAQNTTNNNILNTINKYYVPMEINKSNNIMHDYKNDIWEEKNLFCLKKNIIKNYVYKFFKK